MRTKLLILDGDGILINMTEGHRVCLNQALQEICGYTIPLELHNSTLNGLPTKIKISYLKAHHLINESISIDDINHLKQKYTIDFIKKNIRRDEEKVKIYNYLSTNFDGKFAVYTNSIRDTGELMLETIGFWPTYLVSNTDVCHPKPNPEGYNLIMNHYNVSPWETLVIEDSQPGIQGGLASGAWVWAAAGVESITLENIKRILV